MKFQNANCRLNETNNLEVVKNVQLVIKVPKHDQRKILVDQLILNILEAYYKRVETAVI